MATGTASGMASVAGSAALSALARRIDEGEREGSGLGSEHSKSSAPSSPSLTSRSSSPSAPAHARNLCVDESAARLSASAATLSGEGPPLSATAETVNADAGARHSVAVSVHVATASFNSDSASGAVSREDPQGHAAPAPLRKDCAAHAHAPFRGSGALQQRSSQSRWKRQTCKNVPWLASGQARTGIPSDVMRVANMPAGYKQSSRWMRNGNVQGGHTCRTLAQLSLPCPAVKAALGAATTGRSVCAQLSALGKGLPSATAPPLCVCSLGATSEGARGCTRSGASESEESA
eukprot:1803825-Pleurochrysis_carterae.AAC.1